MVHCERILNYAGADQALALIRQPTDQAQLADRKTRGPQPLNSAHPTSKSSWLTTFADQAVIAIENVRLFEEVQARTRELSEALEQQTATSEVLQVISSSPGELEPVFQAMLANACDFARPNSDFCTIRWRYLEVAAAHGASAYTEYLPQLPIKQPGPETGTARMLGPSRWSSVRPRGVTRLCRTRSGRRRSGRTWWDSDDPRRADAQGRRTDWRHRYLSAGGSAVH